MNLLIIGSMILSVILGVGRGMDLTLFTDLDTGLCLTGSVWLRYAALAVVILLAMLAGRTAKPDARELCSSCNPSAAAAILGGVLLAVAGILKLFLGSGSPLVRGIWAVLAVRCGAWLLEMGKSWQRKEWKRPSENLADVVFGTAIFYWCVLARFMENSSSWQRVEPTVVVWQMLAALVFLSTLGRALSLPETVDSRALCAAGLAAWALCLCWELPELVMTLLQGEGGAIMTLAQLPEILFGLGLCCIGALGGFCAVRITRTEQESRSVRHSVG